MRIGRLLEFRFAKTPPETRPSQLALVAFTASALVALMLAHRMLWAWPPLLLSFGSLFLRLKKVSSWAARAAQYGSYLCLGGTIVLAYVLMAYPVLSDQTANFLTVLAGLGLAGFSLVFLLGTRIWPPAVGLVPCVMGMFTLAAFNGAAHLEPTLFVGGLAGIAYLGLRGPASEQGIRPGSRSRWPRLRVILLLPGIFLVAFFIIWTLPRAQSGVEQTTATLLESSTTHYSSFSAESRLGDLEELRLSKKIVMRVWSSRPQKLRGRIFTQFDGRTWRAPAGRTRNLRQAAAQPNLDAETRAWLEAIPGNSYVFSNDESTRSPDAATIRTKIVQTSVNPGLLVSPAPQLLIRTAATAVSADPHETLTTPLSASVEVYGVINRWDGNLVQPGASPPEMLQEALGLPEQVDPRLAELARQLAGRADSPEERVRQTVRFVQNECHYALNVGKFRTQDPVAEFLFEKKRGYCEYFASAAALLLRLQGIPCRYVTGFSVQEWNRKGGHLVVREADAHAWVEAYVPGRGWIEADPTPDAEYQAVRAQIESGWLVNVKEWAAGTLAEILIYLRRGDWSGVFGWAQQRIKTLWHVLWTRTFGVILLLLAAFFAAIHWLKPTRRSERHRPTQAAAAARETNSREAGELIAFLDEIWAQKGIIRPASRAPLEHVKSFAPEKVGEDFRRASRAAVEYFYSISFGDTDPARERLLSLRKALIVAAQT